ncbi:hypothetical protein H5410_045298 [Solanum commersonii]|uniref:Uncharacterized protein n=1 Tax=Solanum commersonii TaxID=4109 RepID=A0A9J5XDA3_SOLCO|nr:hypothetical protein H5410_045298 [Solanum commersonii]
MQKVADRQTMMISSYKAPKDDSIFEDLNPIVEDLTISDYEKSDLEKKWDSLIQNITNGEDWFFQTYVFHTLSWSKPMIIFSAIDDYLRCDEHLDDIDLEHEPDDNYPSDGYIKDSESSTDS